MDEGPGGRGLTAGDPVRIGGYRVLRRLGAGGMGTVYLCAAPDGRQVAVKVVHQHLAADAEFRARFATEADAGRRVPAFCSARVLESGDHEGRPYLVAEYIDGRPLSRMVAEDGALGLPSLHALAVGTAAGLAAIHGAGLVHRDVKPSNIIMAMGGVRIIDFGIVRALDDTVGFTKTGIVMGSLGWSAPEQLSGDHPSPAMDIFGWGCVIAYAATGDHPFGSGGLDTRAWRILNDEPELDGVPHPLLPLVASALSREPGDRPSATALLLSLVAAAPGGLPPRKVRSWGRPRKATGALVVAVPLTLALVVGAAGARGFEYDGRFTPGGETTVSPRGDQPGRQQHRSTGAPGAGRTGGGQGGGPPADQGGSPAGQTQHAGDPGQQPPSPPVSGVGPAETLPPRSKVPKSKSATEPNPSPTGSAAT